MMGFDDSEPRDKWGMWTANGGVSAASREAVKASDEAQANPSFDTHRDAMYAHKTAQQEHKTIADAHGANALGAEHAVVAKNHARAASVHKKFLDNKDAASAASARGKYERASGGGTNSWKTKR